MMDDGWWLQKNKLRKCQRIQCWNVSIHTYTRTESRHPFCCQQISVSDRQGPAFANHPSSRRVLGTRTQPHAFFWYSQIFGTGYALPVTGVELVCDCRVALFWTGSWYDTWHQFNAHYLFLSRRFPTIIWFWSESDTESCQEWQWQLVGWLVTYFLNVIKHSPDLMTCHCCFQSKILKSRYEG